MRQPLRPTRRSAQCIPSSLLLSVGQGQFRDFADRYQEVHLGEDTSCRPGECHAKLGDSAFCSLLPNSDAFGRVAGRGATCIRDGLELR